MTAKPENPPANHPCAQCGRLECEGTHVIEPIPFQAPSIGFEIDMRDTERFRRALLMTSALSIPVAVLKKDKSNG